jgi:hypothetical protein
MVWCGRRKKVRPMPMGAPQRCRNNTTKSIITLIEKRRKVCISGEREREGEGEGGRIINEKGSVLERVDLQRSTGIPSSPSIGPS